MNIFPSVVRGVSVVALAVTTQLTYTTDARAASFQILKVFDTPLVETATFEFTIQKKELGVWFSIPCLDDRLLLPRTRRPADRQRGRACR